MKTSKTVSFLLMAGGALIIILIVCCPLQAQNPRSYPVPTWQVGDWWDVERASVGFAAPRVMWSRTSRVRYKVEATADIEGYTVYKVSATPEGASAANRYLYFNAADLSIVKDESVVKPGRPMSAQLRTPGQPSWFGPLPLCWPVFPLVEGQTTAIESNPNEFRRADGTIRQLGESEVLLQERCEPGKLYPRQEVSVETVHWGGQDRDAFRVRFRQLNADGTVYEQAILRWVTGIDWPAQAWITEGGGSKLAEWNRVVASSKGLPYTVPPLNISGFTINE
jgi:hypothetical protein